jgi:hypothetical protein
MRKAMPLSQVRIEVLKIALAFLTWDSVPDNMRLSLPGLITGTPGYVEPLDAC